MIEMREIEMRELIEAELDGVAGGMINQDPDGTKRPPVQAPRTSTSTPDLRAEGRIRIHF